MRKPNFLIIGAMKSGTTTLHRYLEQHPSIYMSPIKEPHYFSCRDIDSAPIKTWHDYTKLFDAVSEEIAIGESSTTYLTSKDAANRIKECIPDVKLIVIFRNPVEAAYSLYLMKYRAQLSGKSECQIIEGFDKIARPGEKSGIINGRFYYGQIKYYYDLFGGEQLKFLLYEDLKEDPSSLLREVFEFLGVDEMAINVSKRHNTGGVPKNRFFYNLVNDLKQNQGLRGILPKSLQPAIYNLYLRVRKYNLAASPKLPPDIHATLVERYKDDILKLQDLISRDLSGWLS
ncbi:MAG: sulfotransferase [Verrucomicrobiota bacterium]